MSYSNSLPPAWNFHSPPALCILLLPAAILSSSSELNLTPPVSPETLFTSLSFPFPFPSTLACFAWPFPRCRDLVSVVCLSLFSFLSFLDTTGVVSIVLSFDEPPVGGGGGGGGGGGAGAMGANDMMRGPRGICCIDGFFVTFR